MQCRSHSRRLTSECLFVMDEYAEEKRAEKILIVRSGISEAETTNNKRLCSTFCIEAMHTRICRRQMSGEGSQQGTPALFQEDSGRPERNHVPNAERLIHV